MPQASHENAPLALNTDEVENLPHKIDEENSLAVTLRPDKSKAVKTVRRILLLGAIVLAGCHTAHDVAVTSFRVIDAPANYVRRHIDGSSSATTTTTTTAGASDSVTPGRTVQVAPNKPQPRQVTTSAQPSPSAPPRVTRNTVAEKPQATPNPASKSAANGPTQFPTAKAVPGKPGYVFSPYDPNGGYVDVNGFSSGSKVKDPYSGKIFLVP